MKEWKDLPPEMQGEEVRVYYDQLKKKTLALKGKRLFDLVVSALMIVVASPLLLGLAIVIKLDSRGPVFFKQVRVTRYNQPFKVWKFRTMVDKADQMGSHITAKEDRRITRVGKKIRNSRLDELPQLFNILGGTMTFVGTRPEVPKYVERYTPEMMATLLLPAGVTSMASICFKDESELLQQGDDIDKIYVEKVLPQKMAYNLKSLQEFSFVYDIKLMWKTVKTVFFH